MAPMMDGHRTATGIRRRAQPRTDVAPGSIMVAGTNAIIQPFPGPTGWRVIGRTPHTIVDIRQSPPTSFGPGDAVTFVRIGSHQAALLEARSCAKWVRRDDGLAASHLRITSVGW